jgi:hypothetical protein
MLAPIIKAVQKVYGGSAGKGKQVWLGLQAEMGASVFEYPDSYITIAQRVKKYCKGQASVKVAVMLNHAYATGSINRLAAPQPVHPPSEMAHLDGGWGPLMLFNQWPNHAILQSKLASIRKLINAQVDVLGISNYAVTPVAVRPEHLESAIKKLDAELRAIGINIRKWRQRQGKAFIMNEFGMGGGSSECGDTISKSAADAGRTPWLGITKPFNSSLNPWAVPALNKFACDYFGAALRLLQRGGVSYAVDGAFLWNMVSWDVQAIHPASSGREGSYAVPFIVDAIRAHNRRSAVHA